MTVGRWKIPSFLKCAYTQTTRPSVLVYMNDHHHVHILSLDSFFYTKKYLFYWDTSCMNGVFILCSFAHDACVVAKPFVAVDELFWIDLTIRLLLLFTSSSFSFFIEFAKIFVVPRLMQQYTYWSDGCLADNYSKEMKYF